MRRSASPLNLSGPSLPNVDIGSLFQVKDDCLSVRNRHGLSLPVPFENRSLNKTIGGCLKNGLLAPVVSITPACVDAEEEESRVSFWRDPKTRVVDFLQKPSRSLIDIPQSKRSTTGSDRSWNAIISIVLVEGRNLIPQSCHCKSLPDLYVKFRLGSETYKSKPAPKTLDPKWLEQFYMHIFEESDQLLEVMVCNRRQQLAMGRCTIDLRGIDRENSHQRWYDLEDGAGEVLLIISITGTPGSNAEPDLPSDELVTRSQLLTKYSFINSFINLKDVGFLTVKVVKARGLASADIGGKSDPFCVLELVNARLHTHTEYKTLDPQWNRVFTFAVEDVNSILELTIYDEDRNNKVDFLGKIAIPLLKVKAGVKTFYPRQKKCTEQDTMFKKNPFKYVAQLKPYAMASMKMAQFMQSCLNWENPSRSITALTVFIFVVYWCELYMLPLLLLLLFIKGYLDEALATPSKTMDCAEEHSDSEDDEEVGYERDERKNLKDQLQIANSILSNGLNGLGFIVSSIQRVKNLFNFTQPFLSCIAMTVLAIGTIALYYVPLRWIIMAWGINTFTKKLYCPHAIPNYELIDFLSRVPSNSEVKKYTNEFRPELSDRPPQPPPRRRKEMKTP